LKSFNHVDEAGMDNPEDYGYSWNLLLRTLPCPQEWSASISGILVIASLGSILLDKGGSQPGFSITRNLYFIDLKNALRLRCTVAYSFALKQTAL
jgi:hypothetical protein